MRSCTLIETQTICAVLMQTLMQYDLSVQAQSVMGYDQSET